MWTRPQTSSRSRGRPGTLEQTSEEASTTHSEEEHSNYEEQCCLEWVAWGSPAEASCSLEGAPDSWGPVASAEPNILNGRAVGRTR